MELCAALGKKWAAVARSRVGCSKGLLFSQAAGVWGEDASRGGPATVRSVGIRGLAAVEAREQPELRQVLMQGGATRGGEVV